MNSGELIKMDTGKLDDAPTFSVPYDLDLTPEQFDDDLKALLDQWDEEAAEYVESKRPKNTKDAYAQDWDTWRTFCSSRGIPTTAIRIGTLTMFVGWLWNRENQRRGKLLGTYTAPNTIDRRLSGVVVTGRKRLGLNLPANVAEPARELLKRLKKEMEESGEKRGTGKAPALLIPHIQAISAALPDNNFGLRSRAVVTLQFAVAGREHEIAALRQRDVLVNEHGLLVTVRVSKTSAREVPVLYGQHLATCPVRSVLVWLDALADAGLCDPDAPLFCALDPHNLELIGVALTPKRIGGLVVDASKRAALGVRHTGHSPRRGLATEARRAGRDRKVIAKQGGWVEGSKAMEGYFEDADRYEDNALIGIGL